MRFCAGFIRADEAAQRSSIDSIYQLLGRQLFADGESRAAGAGILAGSAVI
jgi:hypothetical protein